MQQNAADGTPLPTDGVMNDKSNKCSRDLPRQSPRKVVVNKKWTIVKLCIIDWGYTLYMEK